MYRRRNEKHEIQRQKICRRRCGGHAVRRVGLGGQAARRAKAEDGGQPHVPAFRVRAARRAGQRPHRRLRHRHGGRDRRGARLYLRAGAHQLQGADGRAGQSSRRLRRFRHVAHRRAQEDGRLFRALLLLPDFDHPAQGSQHQDRGGPKGQADRRFLRHAVRRLRRSGRGRRRRDGQQHVQHAGAPSRPRRRRGAGRRFRFHPRQAASRARILRAAAGRTRQGAGRQRLRLFCRRVPQGLETGTAVHRADREDAGRRHDEGHLREVDRPMALRRPSRFRASITSWRSTPPSRRSSSLR